jgi:cytochrome c
METGDRKPVPVQDSIRRELAYIKPIAGKNDTLSTQEVQRGQVLIAYSDCHTCHQENQRAKGPAFKDIARRYPVNDGYIELLAQKIIIGGRGAWGNPEMSPHEGLSREHAKLMVKYILSLKE